MRDLRVNFFSYIKMQKKRQIKKLIYLQKYEITLLSNSRWQMLSEIDV